MVYYKLVKITINALGLADVILDMVIQYHSLPDSIVNDQGLVFNSKFWSLLCYFLRIKQKLSTAFYLQTNSQTKKYNSTMKACLQAFVNFEQKNWTRLLLMAEFVYYNAKNASTDHTSFELNRSFHPQAFYEKDVDLRSQSKSVDKIASELKELIAIYRENL